MKAASHLQWLRQGGWCSQSKGVAPARYFEIDFPEVTAKKAAIMHSAPAIAGLLPPNAVVEPGAAPVQWACPECRAMWDAYIDVS